MQRIDVYYRARPGDVVPAFDQFSMSNFGEVKIDNGAFVLPTTKGIIMLPMDLVRRVDIINCG